MAKILQVLDPSHQDWVLGGMFKDLRFGQESFEDRPIFISPPNTFLNIFRWIIQSLKVSRSDYVLFSSLTALENFGRSRIKRKGQTLGVWFTHQEFAFSNFERKLLQRCRYIFVHSESTRNWLQTEFPKSHVIRFVGAIDLRRFNRPAKPGADVVWVGTPAGRKNPELLLELASAAPHLKFRVLGKNWGDSNYMNKLAKLSNVEYREISGPLSSSDFDGCLIYLMLSRIEGGPMPLLESLAAGLIPVCTRTGFVEDLLSAINLDHNIVDGFNTEEIIQLMENLTDIDKDVQGRISFAKQFDFNRLRSVILGAYFG
jgi:glycosyltransferase involved in cell wall biosynthesis